MSLGVRYTLSEINVGDTAELYASLVLEGRPVKADEIDGVSFIVQTPKDVLEGPFEGEVLEDGRGYYQWTKTSEPGEYLAQAQFTVGATGEIASVMVNFAVNDPFDTTPVTHADIVVDDVWMRLEDAFDSVEGGPWLRDETRAAFDKNKISRYINETILDINVQMPLSNVTIGEFATPQADGTQNPLLPLLSKGVLCRVIQHLVRSYIEQPVPQGAQIVWNDRTRYAQAWKEVYADEHSDYITMVRLWKRGMLHLGHSALLVSSKAGRLYFNSRMRASNIGRGFF